MTREDLIAMLEAAGAMRPDGAHSVWDMREPGLFALRGHARSDGARLATVEFMRLQPCPLFIDLSEPADAEEWGDVDHHASGYFTVREDAPAARLLAAGPVVEGNWRLLCVSRPPPKEELRDFLRADAADVAAFVERHALRALVDSFHDDTHWRVALAEAR